MAEKGLIRALISQHFIAEKDAKKPKALR